MAKATNKLRARQIEGARYEGRTRKLADGEGLFLLIDQYGKHWRFRFRWQRRERLLSLGSFPAVSLSEAREQRDELRRMLRRGEDPSEARRAARAAESGENSFRAVALEWLGKQTQLSEATRELTRRRWQRWIFPEFGDDPIDTIEPSDVLKALRKIEAAGRYETARRMRQRCSEVFRYAIASGRATRDPAADVKGALSPVPTKSRAAITDPKRFGELLRSIDAYGGEPVVRIALQVLAATAVRPGEARLATWDEFTLDGEAPAWRVPSARMKQKRAHVVPLAPQVVELLRELRSITGASGYVFESPRRGRPISENAMGVAMKALGYGGDLHSPHGFRSSFSTMLAEQGFDADLVEAQLAHARPGVKAVYDRSHRLEARRQMMAHWAGFLDELRAGEALQATA